LMDSRDARTCAFLTTGRGVPVQLVDAYSGEIRCSYRCFCDKDELESATAIAFSPDGERILASGFRSNRTIKAFRTAVPGREFEVLKLGKTRRSGDGQKGMVSAMAYRRTGDAFAVGTYSPGSIYVYDDRSSCASPAGIVLDGDCLVDGCKQASWKGGTAEDCEEEEQFLSKGKFEWFRKSSRPGITQLTWSHDGNFLYSASRRSAAVLSWDVRMLGGTNAAAALHAYARDGDTNQRLAFDFDDTGNRLFLASRDKSVKVYDVHSPTLLYQIDAFADVVNGVSVHGPKDDLLLAVATGDRKFACDDSNQPEDHPPSGSLELFSCQTPGMKHPKP